jgi:uncharacterized membrane protein
MVLSNTLEFLHIISVFILLGALGMITYSSVMIPRTNDVLVFKVYVGVGAAGGMVAALMTLFVGGFGALTAWKIGYSLDSGWLIAAYIATTAAFIVPALTFKPWGEKVEKLMGQAVEEDRILPEQLEILTGTKHRIVEVFMYLLLVFIAYVMVFKPF